MNITEAAQLLDISPKTVRRWIQKGKLNATKISENGAKEWVIQQEDIDFMNSNSDAMSNSKKAALSVSKPNVIVSSETSTVDRSLVLLENVLTALKDQIDRKDAQIAYLQNQIHDFNEQQKALTANVKKPWWKRLDKN